MTEQDSFTEIETYLALQPFSSQTRISYKYLIRRLLQWCSQENLALEQFDSTAFLRFSDSCNWKVGSCARRSAYHCLRGYLQWKLDGFQPLEGLRLLRPMPEPQRTLNKEELDRIIDALLAESHYAAKRYLRHIAIRNLAIISLIVDTGLRSTEIWSLKLSGLDLESRRVSVLGKWRKWREPVFSKTTQERLHRWLTVRPLIAKSGVDNVFVGIGGRKPGRTLSNVGLRVAMLRIARETGVAHFSPLALRRTMATLLIRNGAPTRLVQAQAGWSKLAMIENYAQAIRPEDIAPYFATS